MAAWWSRISFISIVAWQEGGLEIQLSDKPKGFSLQQRSIAEKVPTRPFW